MFSQDFLYGECIANPDFCNTIWEEGSFANDIFGVSYAKQDMGGPVGDLIANSGEGSYNIQYLPLAGLENISNSPAQNPFQDHITVNKPGMPMVESFENFDSDENLSLIHI